MHEGVGKTMEVLAFGPADSSKKSCVAKEYRAEVAVPGDGLAAASAVVVSLTFFIFKMLMTSAAPERV